MFSRRIATAAVLLALFGAACASHDGAKVAAGADVAAAVPTTTVVVSTTAATMPAPEPAPAPAPEPAPTPAPVVKSAPTPKAATIEVDYQPQEGSTATATLAGPNGSHAKSLDSGAAVFGGLPAGTYTVTITVDSPSGDPTVGDARVIINGGTIHVEAGEHGVITCDDNGCTGAL